MSAHGHDHGHDSEIADAHGHDDHEHDSDELPPDEPHTPGWLPLLGAGLFLGAILLYVVTRPAEGTGETGTAEAPATAEPSPAPAPVAPPNPHMRVAPGGAAAGIRPVAPPGHDAHDGHGH